MKKFLFSCIDLVFSQSMFFFSHFFCKLFREIQLLFFLFLPIFYLKKIFQQNWFFHFLFSPFPFFFRICHRRVKCILYSRYTIQFSFLMALFLFMEMNPSHAAIVTTRVGGAANWSANASWLKTMTGNIKLTNGSKAVVGTGTFFSSEIQVGDVLILIGSPATIRGTVASITNNTNLVLVANAAINSTAAYGIQGIPGASDDVYIGNAALTAINLTLDITSVNIRSLNFIGSGLANTLTHTGTNSLNISTDARMNQPTSPNVTISWNINAGTVTVGDSMSFLSVHATSVNRISKIAITTGLLDINGPLTFNYTKTGGTAGTTATAVMDLSGGAAFLKVGGNIAATSGTLLAGNASTVVLDGAGSQAISSVFTNFYHLTIDKISGTATPGAGLTINGSLNISLGGTLQAGSFTHVLMGDFISSGTFTASTSTFNLNGSILQNIGGNSSTTFNLLNLNNAAGYQLNQVVQVSGTVTFNSGIMQTDSVNVLTINSTGTFSGGSSTTYVSGPLAIIIGSAAPISKTYHIGIAGVYRKVILSVTHTNATAVKYTIATKNASAKKLSYTLPIGISDVSGNSYFTVYRESVANLSSANINAFYSANDYITTPSSLRMVEDNGSNAWVNLNGSGNTTPSGNINTTSFSSFGTKFTYANATGGGNPLPVDIINFQVKVHENDAEASWTTEMEKNSWCFHLERSIDSAHFENIGMIDGAGDSFTEKDYHLYDETFGMLRESAVYYRLKHIDFDGYFTYGKTLSVQTKSREAFLGPNPSHGYFFLKTPIPVSRILILNAIGEMVKTIQIQNVRYEFDIDISAYPSGLYFIIAYDENETVYKNILSKL